MSKEPHADKHSAPEHPDDPRAKTGPTRTRKEAEAARKRPLVGGDRKAAKARERERRAQERAALQEGLRSGDEKLLPPRDQGKVKRYTRDIVDTRLNVGEFILIVLIIVVFSPFLFVLPGLRDLMTPEESQQIGTYVLVAMIALWLADSFWLWFIIRKKVGEAYGEEGLAERPMMYGVMRAWNIRRLRLPRPQLKRSETAVPK